ncbi:MAG: FMN-binding protein, partial [Porticoccaceae bacterium]|nr:FMN-binding protein [Porticoccaceae bacterium]
MFAERDSIRKNSITLGAVALITGTLLATTQMATKDKIALAQRQAEQKALLEILPLEQHSNDLLMDVVAVPRQYWKPLGLKQGGNIHIGRDAEGKVKTLILPTVAQDGYSGAIKLIVGIHTDGTLAGVRITEHRETPG